MKSVSGRSADLSRESQPWLPTPLEIHGLKIFHQFKLPSRYSNKLDRAAWLNSTLSVKQLGVVPLHAQCTTKKLHWKKEKKSFNVKRDWSPHQIGWKKKVCDGLATLTGLPKGCGHFFRLQPRWNFLVMQLVQTNEPQVQGIREERKTEPLHLSARPLSMLFVV